MLITTVYAHICIFYIYIYILIYGRTLFAPSPATGASCKYGTLPSCSSRPAARSAESANALGEQREPETQERIPISLPSTQVRRPEANGRNEELDVGVEVGR